MLIKTKIGKNGIEEENKIKIAIDRLKAHEPPDGYYVAFSGGKDSVVIKKLCELAGVKHDIHYNLTTVDPPELVYFIKDKYSEVKINKPDITMWKLIPKKKMPPTRIMRYCCEVLKERGGNERVVVTGIRWAESASRSKRKMAESCYKHSKKFYINPIIDWTKKDVWDFIKQYNIEYCDLYDEGFDRLGCVGCPMQGPAGMKRDFKRWPKFKEAYIRAFDRMIKARRKSGLETNWENGEEVMNWWINGGCDEKVVEGQMSLILMNNN